MPTTGNYFLNGATLNASTAVYTNQGLTTLAPDGYYRQGSLVRRQAGGSLLSHPEACPSCTVPCGGGISASGAQGVYLVNLDLGTDTGAVVIRFDPQSVPDGILATYNEQAFNGLSSAVSGWKQAPPGLPTFLGQSFSDCGIVANSPYTLNQFLYAGNNVFESTGSTTIVSVVPGQVQLTAFPPSSCVMVIPKPTASPSILNIEAIGPCSRTLFSLSVNCPAALPSFTASAVSQSSSGACQSQINQTYYFANATTFSALTTRALVFSDPNGQNKLPAGYYRIDFNPPFGYLQVDENGVVVAFGTCELAVSSVSGYMASCTGGSINEYMGAELYLDSEAQSDITFDVRVSYVFTGNTCGASKLSQDFTIVVPAGDSSGSVDACSGGLYVPGGAEICGACIVSCDDPNVNFEGFEC